MASSRSKRHRAARFIQPVIDFGEEAKGGISSLLEEMMGLLRDPSQIRDNPEFQFLQSEGLRGLSQGYGAAGKLLSGQAGRGFIQQSQNVASTFLSQMLQRRGGVLQGLFEQYQPAVAARGQMSSFVGNQESGGSLLGGALQLGATALGAYYGGRGAPGGGAGSPGQGNYAASRAFTQYGNFPGEGGRGGFTPFGQR